MAKDSLKNNQEPVARLTKDVTRDGCLILFQIWNYGDLVGIEKITGLTGFSDRLFYVFDSNDGLTTSYVREDIMAQGSRELEDRILREPALVKKIFGRYERLLLDLESFWAKDALGSKEDLFDFIDLLKESWGYMGLSYGLPNIGGISQEDKDLALKYRVSGDKFFDRSDAILRDTIKGLYPSLAGYEKYVLIEELNGVGLPSQDDLEKRSHHYIYALSKVFVDKDIDDFAEEYRVEFEKSLVKDVEELRGQVACGGVARGVVRIVLLKEAISSLEDGEILVTAMTTPDFLPAMKKAAAFITDEGGITCHAAIIARELKKPCIIGTRNATQILKDGMMVEVDASAGWLRLSNKEPSRFRWLSF